MSPSEARNGTQQGRRDDKHELCVRRLVLLSGFQARSVATMSMWAHAHNRRRSCAVAETSLYPGQGVRYSWIRGDWSLPDWTAGLWTFLFSTGLMIPLLILFGVVFYIYEK